MIKVRFEDGSVVLLPETVAERVVGKDADGDVLVPLMETVPELGYVPLTSCCFRDGKGGEHGIICRGCYRPVDPKHGSTDEIAVRVADPRYVEAEVEEETVDDLVADDLRDVKRKLTQHHVRNTRPSNEELANMINALDRVIGEIN